MRGSSEAVAAIVSLLCMGGVAFILGVGFAAYRALSWRERIEAWAATYVAECTNADQVEQTSSVDHAQQEGIAT